MHQMEVPRRKLETGKRAFSYAAPIIWNNLRQTIRQIDLASVSLSSFKKQLKTNLSVLHSVNWLVFFPPKRIACHIRRVINSIYIHTYILMVGLTPAPNIMLVGMQIFPEPIGKWVSIEKMGIAYIWKRGDK